MAASASVCAAVCYNEGALPLGGINVLHATTVPPKYLSFI